MTRPGTLGGYWSLGCAVINDAIGSKATLSFTVWFSSGWRQYARFWDRREEEEPPFSKNDNITYAWVPSSHPNPASRNRPTRRFGSGWHKECVFCFLFASRKQSRQDGYQRKTGPRKMSHEQRPEYTPTNHWWPLTTVAKEHNVWVWCVGSMHYHIAAGVDSLVD